MIRLKSDLSRRVLTECLSKVRRAKASSCRVVALGTGTPLVFSPTNLSSQECAALLSRIEQQQGRVLVKGHLKHINLQMCCGTCPTGPLGVLEVPGGPSLV